MKKIVIAVVFAVLLISFFSVFSDSEAANIILSHQPASAKFTACKSVLKNDEIFSKQQQEAGLEPIAEKKQV